MSASTRKPTPGRKSAVATSTRRPDSSCALQVEPHLEFAPLTPECWQDLEKLFGPIGACGGCWCQWWKRSAQEYRRSSNEANRRALKASVDQGATPGFIGYVGGEPIAWCAVEPRESYPRLQHSRSLKPVDGKPVRSMTCLFVKAGHRRKGLSLRMIEAAKGFVAGRAGQLLEAYPRENFNGANAMWTGVAATFREAGCVEVTRGASGRPIMRFELAPIRSTP
jgi:hypothetical protein